jgi:DNA-binding NtrC family response regulator
MNDASAVQNKIIRIIVVDDDDIFLSLVQDTLEDSGYEIVLSGNCDQALKSIEEKPFDLMITDIRMPGLDGVELAQRARISNPAISVIFMTGYTNLSTAQDAVKEGACDYIMKPFELSEFRQAIIKAISKKSNIDH